MATHARRQRPSGPASRRRVHIVLVPGFAGFDALGGLEDHADVTPLFHEWRDRDARRRSAVLHYFDNYPSAAVSIRADRLRRYLAKRVARGEFQPGDGVALVGHSTGGLDIRCLLEHLTSALRRQTRVDGAHRAALGVEAADVLELIERVVFLSVPHRGTNIADWIASYETLRHLVIQQLRATVDLTDVPAARLVQDLATRSGAWLTGTDVLLAMRDALREADPDVGPDGPRRVADAYESAAALTLWLRHMATDFAVIDDLSVRPREGRPLSPAQVGDRERARETAAWAKHGIRIRSYATLARPPIQPPADDVAPWVPLNPWSYPPCAPDTPHDALYSACYRACAGGPFAPVDHSAVRFRHLRPTHRELLSSWGVGKRLRAWENDGIVNTASMIWPGAGETFLVPGDHMDIVGHYRTVKVSEPGPRAFHTYNLLKSGSAFGDEDFKEVWNDVFDFCCERK